MVRQLSERMLLLPNLQVVRPGVPVLVHQERLVIGTCLLYSVAIVQRLNLALVRHTALKQIPMVQLITIV